MNNLPNKREFSRIETTVTARVVTENATVSGATESLSLNGVFVITDTVLPEGTECKVVLSLSTGKEDIPLELGGTVVRCKPAGFAIAFNDIDVDSLEHLRNLVRYNADDADTVETEFDRHVGLNPREPVSDPE